MLNYYLHELLKQIHASKENESNTHFISKNPHNKQEQLGESQLSHFPGLIKSENYNHRTNHINLK